MTTEVKHRRGTTAQHAAFTGAVAEITYDTDKKTLVAHDGATVGGFPLARQDQVEVGRMPTATYDPQTIEADVFDRANHTGKQALGTVTGFRGYIHGLTLANNVADATNDLDIAAGVAVSDASPHYVIEMASGLTKRLDASWAVGSNQGGLDTGSPADTTYHVWLVQRSDTGVVDVLFSTSATSPTMPANYDRKRRIGSILRESGSIVAFVQDGDVFQRAEPWTGPAVDPGTAAVYSTLGVPTGIRVGALLSVGLAISATSAASYALLVSDPNLPDVTPTTGNCNIVLATQTGVLSRVAVTAVAMTNTSAQIRYRLSASDAALVVNLTVRAWNDNRGR